MFGDHYGYMVGMHGFWWAFWIIIVIALLLRRSDRADRASRTPTAQETPQTILKRRLAAGELDVEEYEKRKAILDRD